MNTAQILQALNKFIGKLKGRKHNMKNIREAFKFKLQVLDEENTMLRVDEGVIGASPREVQNLYKMCGEIVHVISSEKCWLDKNNDLVDPNNVPDEPEIIVPPTIASDPVIDESQLSTAPDGVLHVPQSVPIAPPTERRFVPPVKKAPLYYSAEGIEFKLEDGVLYQNIWAKQEDMSQYKILSSKTSNEMNNDKYILMKKEWRVVQYAVQNGTTAIR